MQCLCSAAVLSMSSILGEAGSIAPFVAPVSQSMFEVRGVVRVEATRKPMEAPLSPLIVGPSGVR